MPDWSIELTDCREFSLGLSNEIQTYVIENIPEGWSLLIASEGLLRIISA